MKKKLMTIIVACCPILALASGPDAVYLKKGKISLTRDLTVAPGLDQVKVGKKCVANLAESSDVSRIIGPSSGTIINASGWMKQGDSLGCQTTYTFTTTLKEIPSIVCKSDMAFGCATLTTRQIQNRLSDFFSVEVPQPIRVDL